MSTLPEANDARCSDELMFFCNGRKIIDRNVDPRLTLLTYLRSKLLLTGSKLGCGEGGCGACTAMVSVYSTSNKTISHCAINACLTPICFVHGMAVTTVEGIGSTRSRLHPVQERLAKAHGSQCGFCSPGMVMSMYALLRNKPQPSMEDIEGALEGNLCRCTGYRPILQGYQTFTKESCCGSAGSAKCCMDNTSNVDAELEGISVGLFDSRDFVPYDPSQDLIFPPDLMLSLNEMPPKLLKFAGDHVTWFRPVTLNQLLGLKVRFPQSKILAGNSEIGIDVKFKGQEYPILIDVNHIPDLNSIQIREAGIRVGASVSLTSLKDSLRAILQSEPECKTRVLAAFHEMLRWFAGSQIRNVASLGGNIATSSPISDLNPLLLAAECRLDLVSSAGTREVTMDGSFFTGYRQNAIGSDEIILAVHIPFTAENEYFYGFKQSQRREDDIAIVNAGMRVVLKPDTNVVEDCTLAYGGMAPTTVLAVQTMNSLKGSKWSDGLVEAMCPLLAQDLHLPPGSPGGMEPYRQALSLSFFFKFYLAVLEQINLRQPGASGSSVPASYKTAIGERHPHKPAQGLQLYQEVPPGQPSLDPVGRPVIHHSALKQVTGEATYVDDIPPLKGELYLGLVLSSKAHANILSVDASAALAMQGVHSFVDVDDVPGSNMLGQLQDNPLYADNEVTCVGQVIGVVVADNKDIAQRAAKLVKVEYEELPAIFTIKDAIQHSSYFPYKKVLGRGDVDAAFASCDHVLEGELSIGAQEHFYLETFATLVVPGDGDEVEVISGSQGTTMAQTMVAQALGVSLHQVVSRTKRTGGAFGAKASRSSLHAAVCAVAANKVRRPVRLMLDRDEDMTHTGTRHPFLAVYKVGFSNSGRLRALEVKLYNNGGNTSSSTCSVMDKALLNICNCYSIANVKVTGFPCKTNIASNTAFRGFGGPQGQLTIETIVAEIASKYGLSPVKIRELNFYREGEKTFYGQELTNWNLSRCWDECLTKSNYLDRKRDVDEFNRDNRWKKRGIYIVPTKYGIGFPLNSLNQAGALVHIYTDGTVLLTHGGTEMGQGLHTKMIQVASRTLRIPAEKVRISESSTSTVPNTSPTAGSTGTDLNGMAVKNACETILHRLEPFMHENPKGTWESWVGAAYMNRVSLSTTGFYKSPELTFNWEKCEGRKFIYFVYGVAASEIEIDCLTGDHRVLRTDIVMDLGDSLNPAIDIGQIEGGFIQGYGLFVMEDYRMTPTGHLLTKGPGFYKIPAFGDVPTEFNVSLLTKVPNPHAVCSSKAIGEPSLFLASSVFFAIREAIQSARQDAGIDEPFRLDSPAIAERVRMACRDQFTQQCPLPDPGTYTPFFIRP